MSAFIFGLLGTGRILVRQILAQENCTKLCSSHHFSGADFQCSWYAQDASCAGESSCHGSCGSTSQCGLYTSPVGCKKMAQSLTSIKLSEALDSPPCLCRSAMLCARECEVVPVVQPFVSGFSCLSSASGLLSMPVICCSKLSIWAPKFCRCEPRCVDQYAGPLGSLRQIFPAAFNNWHQQFPTRPNLPGHSMHTPTAPLPG